MARNDRIVRVEARKQARHAPRAGDSPPSSSIRRVRLPRPLAPRGAGYLARQQRLMRMLDDHKALSVERAAAELGCSRRTIYRDFLVLAEPGVPL
jgi:AraC-like DNA-binding protein